MRFDYVKLFAGENASKIYRIKVKISTYLIIDIPLENNKGRCFKIRTDNILVVRVKVRFRNIDKLCISHIHFNKIKMI